MKKLQTSIIRVTGMHCPSCDILVKTQLEDMPHIVSVEPDHKRNEVTIQHRGTLSHAQINKVLCQYGYQVQEDDAPVQEEQLQKKLTDALILAGILGICYYFAQELRIIPDAMGTTITGPWGAFVLGLIASASTCMATTGALFTSYLHKQKSHEHTPLIAALFMGGRILGYGLMGYVLGIFGQALSLVAQWGAVFNLIIALLLIVSGLDMLRLLSLSTLLEKLSIRPSRWFGLQQGSRMANVGAFGLGFATYFLPCGFTISTQAYALSTGNPIYSSQIMIAFALGTLPSLIFLTWLSRIRNVTLYQYFLKAVGIVVIAIGVGYVWTALSVHGLIPTLGARDTRDAGVIAEIKDGKQYVHMTATSSGYTPNKFVVKKDIPVVWTVDGEDVYGCQGSLQAPQAGIQITYLKEGENRFEFIPKERGAINFSCSMGMFGGTFTVL